MAACPGEEVVFTCRTIEATFLIWNSDQFSSEDVFTFAPADPQNPPRVDGNFTATLTEVIVNPNDGRFANFTSTLAVTATVELTGTVVECTDSIMTEDQTLLVAG